jgi:hypothetical protein
MRVAFKLFHTLSSWGEVFTPAAVFATQIGPDRLIGISHSAGGTGFGTSGVATVWYWENNPEAQAAPAQEMTGRTTG